MELYVGIRPFVRGVLGQLGILKYITCLSSALGILMSMPGDTGISTTLRDY